MGWMDDPEVSLTAASANVGATAPGQWWEKDQLVQTQPRAATGVSEAFQAGLQGSAPGLAWRQKLPDLVMDPAHARWWERAAAGIAQVGAELPLMAVGGAAGAPVGAAVGGAAGTAVPVVGNVAGAAIGGVLGTGAGMFAVPAAIRESLIQAYKSGDVRTSADWWNILREVATTTVKEGAIGAATFGAGSIAARTVGKAIAPAIGESIAIPTATKIIGTADTAAQIATMVTMPAALQGRLPDAQEFLDAAIVIGGLKAAHPIAARITNVFQRTGRTPGQQVEDAKADPKIAEELKNGPVPEEPWIPSRLPEYTKQEELWSIQSRLGELEAKATDTPDVKTVDAAGNPVTVPGRRAELFTYAEKQEYDALKVRAAAMEAQGVIPEVPRGTSPPGSPRYAPDQLTAATERAKTRLEDLATKSGTEALTDAERAERVLLTNAMGNPEALAKRFGMEPAIRVPTSAEVEASAQRVYDDVLRQAKEADSARQAAGNTPLGDEHAQAVAALVRARVRTRAARLGMLPEEIYNEKPLQIRDETQQEVAQVQAEAAAAPELPRFTTPEVDLFGNPVEPQTTPRYAVENMATVELPLKDLVLSKEVPQFKAAANAEGVIVPLGGKFDRTGVGPIQVWERTDGTLEVISGRHRLDLARRSGEETIPAQIHREADGFDARQAATLDAQLNIREEQGSVADYAQYFKDAGITKEAADELGLLARAKGRTGFAIARDASPDLLEAHRAGLLSDEAALAITQTAPGSERLQALGIAMVNDGKSILMATNTMRAVDLMAAERMAAGQQGDIFGFDDSAMREAASMAKKASSAQRKISEQISAVNGASKRPELARKMGVDVQDPEGIQKKIAELKQEQYQWDNWPLYPELVAKLRAADTLKQEPLYQDEFELKPETPAELKARDEEAAAAAKRKLAPARAGVKGPVPTVDQADLFNTQRTLFQTERNKVVDTTEKENALSDAIGKSMADRIINDPNQTGTIEGENININDTGMAGYYDRIVPKVAEKVAKQVGGGKVTEVTLGEAIKEQEGTVTIGGEDTVSMVNSGRLKDHELSAMEILEGGDIGEIRTIDQAIAEARARMMDPDQADVKDYATQVLADLMAWKQKGVKITYPEEVVPPSKQMAIEITPEMREKIMAGMPLFQKPGQERDGQHLGSYSIADNLITTFRNANKSTVIHELSHSWLEEMRSDAMRPNAPAQIKADWDLLRREFAIGETGEISTASHEQFARTGERYFGEGVAPSVGLRGVFERFKAWMLEIYGNLQNLGVTINPEVKGVFDRMIATDQEIADAKALDVPTAYVPEARRAEAEKIVQPPEGRKIEPGFAAEKASMQPYADELPKGPGEAPDNSHINYAYINSPMDVKLAMQRMAEIDQANIQKQRGGTAGVKSWAEANAEQARYVNDILDGSEDTLRLLQPRDPNAAGPDVKLGILKKLAVGAAKDSARLRDVVLAAGHDATVRQQLEYMGSIERARMIQAEFLGERAGVARALNALKDVTEGSGEIARMLDAIGYGAEAARELFQTARTPAEEQAYMRAQLDAILQNYKGKTVLDIAKLHKEIGTLKGTFKMAKDIEKASTWEMIVEGWRSGLLSGPVTHTTNLFGTGAFQALRAPVDALAAVIGMARGASPGMGESDRASMSEAIGRITGMLGGVQEGIKVGYHTFMADQTTGKTESYREAIPGRAGELIRIPLRMMGAEDALVSTMYLRGELRTLAIRQAFDEHMNPGTREFATRVDYLMDHPTPEIQLQAENAATRMTFNMPLGEKGVALQLFVQKWNLQWMIPFIRTPINIAKELLRMSPFAPAVAEWRQAMAKGGVERDRAIAEIALGSGITALTMAYAFSGDITGGPSPDPGKNRAKAGVWQPYSIKIGDTWYEYARIQPTGTLMGMAADIAAIWDHMNDEEKDKLPKMLAAAFAQAITNQTFLQGITNFVNAMSDPTRFGPRFLQQFAGSMVPNVIGQPTTMADPVVREVNGMIEAVQARIPGFRQQLLPKRDWLGEPVQTKERTGFIMPVREQPISEDKVRLEADRLGLSVAAAPKKTHLGKGTGKLGDVEFTPEERDKFEQAAGQMAHPILTNIVNAPGYDEMPDLVKRKIFAQVVSASHRVAAVAALPPEKRTDYLQQITERMQAELAPGEP